MRTPIETYEPVSLSKEILSVIANARNYTQATSPHDVFMDAETLVGTLAFLIGPLMDLETAYRQKVVVFMAEGDSAAKAEAKAKASEEYKNWKKVEMAYQLAEEQIRLSKKFKDTLEMEYKRS